MNHVEATIWSMNEGQITELKYDARVWVVKTKYVCRNVKKNYFIKYLSDKKPGDIFRLDDFYKAFPKHKTDNAYKDRLDKTISGLIKNGRIVMWVNPDEFKVLK